MRLGNSQMCFLLGTAMLVGCAPTPYRESTGEFIDDSVISTKVKTDLVRCPMVNGFDVKVETFKNRVQLSGFVNDSNQAEQASKLARRIGGVKAVENHLSIK